ncbi:MAG: permease prefix domain 1-containing protein [Gemmatimonadales bacterium]
MLEQLIEQWRSYLRNRQTIHAVDIAELEDHLREQIAALTTAGLAEDEAFMVAVKRLGGTDALSREFAVEHSERLWKQLMAPSEPDEPTGGIRTDAFVAVALAILAGVLIKLPALFGLPINGNESFYLRNVGLFVLPLVTGYFLWKRQADTRTIPWLIGAFVVAGVFANAYPFVSEGSTEILAVVHAPLALWLVVGVAYAGDRWRQVAGRMDFIRFSGELFIYYVLIALGGGVLMAFTAGIFEAIGMDIEPFFESWIVPCAPLGGVMIATWLVEAKQSVIENMAPVLARLFTPLFTILLLVYLTIVLVTGRGPDMDRDVLIVFDLLLVVVLGLLLYSISARDPQTPPGPFDMLQVVLVISALLADAVALWAMATRIGELGFTPNRAAALGLNVILLVNLAWSAVLATRWVRGHGAFADLERWQTNYLPVYAVWAAIVVTVFPPLFRYI